MELTDQDRAILREIQRDASLSLSALAERLNMQMDAHCGALPEEMLGGMVEAQRLRDAALAEGVLAALAESSGPVVVITGNGHARLDWGAPRMLERARPDIPSHVADI